MYSNSNHTFYEKHLQTIYCRTDVCIQFNLVMKNCICILKLIYINFCKFLSDSRHFTSFKLCKIFVANEIYVTLQDFWFQPTSLMINVFSFRNCINILKSKYSFFCKFLSDLTLVCYGKYFHKIYTQHW